MMKSEDEADNVMVNLPHHIQQELCTTRAPYRQGKKLTAVKVVGKQVYTVNNESQHLLIYRVPSINLSNELHALCSKFGQVATLVKLELVDPGDEFTDIYHVCYTKIRQARRPRHMPFDGIPEEQRQAKKVKLSEKELFPSISADNSSLGSNTHSVSAGSIQSTNQQTTLVDTIYPGTSRDSITGPYDLVSSYPSQEVLSLPGLEVKKARETKFMPSSIIKRITKPPTNKIIFYNHNGITKGEK